MFVGNLALQDNSVLASGRKCPHVNWYKGGEERILYRKQHTEEARFGEGYAAAEL